MQAVFFEAGGEAGPGSWRHTRLHAIEALAEEFVCIRPAELPRLILQVLACASVVLLNDNLPNQWVLHDDAGELADVCRCRLIILVRESMRVRIVGRLETESACVTVHLLKEVLHGLI